eukprot:Gb_18020 [translate_table: standard]
MLEGETQCVGVRRGWVSSEVCRAVMAQGRLKLNLAKKMSRAGFRSSELFVGTYTNYQSDLSEILHQSQRSPKGGAPPHLDIRFIEEDRDEMCKRKMSLTGRSQVRATWKGEARLVKGNVVGSNSKDVWRSC